MGRENELYFRKINTFWINVDDENTCIYDKKIKTDGVLDNNWVNCVDVKSINEELEELRNICIKIHNSIMSEDLKVLMTNNFFKSFKEELNRNKDNKVK